MGARRAGTTACVDLAGVVARTRVTLGLAFGGRFDLTVALRAVVRALPLTFRCDAFAFNCFPLFGLWPRRSAGNLGLS
jgi:hypothetical protein